MEAPHCARNNCTLQNSSVLGKVGIAFLDSRSRVAVFVFTPAMNQVSHFFNVPGPDFLKKEEPPLPASGYSRSMCRRQK